MPLLSREIIVTKEECGNLALRLMERCDYSWPSECWEWLAGCNKQGYGKIRYKGFHVRAHRLAYACANGACPGGDNVTIDHKCGNPACINPSHLRVLSLTENVLASNAPGVLASRTGTCKRGHKLDGYTNGKSEKRLCRECHRERQRTRALKRKEQGLCRRCSKSAEPGLAVCKYHADADADRARGRASILKASGLCSGCGRVPALPDRILCAACGVRAAARTRKSEARKVGALRQR